MSIRLRPEGLDKLVGQIEAYRDGQERHCAAARLLVALVDLACWRKHKRAHCNNFDRNSEHVGR